MGHGRSPSPRPSPSTASLARLRRIPSNPLKIFLSDPPIEGSPDDTRGHLLSLEDTQTWERSGSGFEDCTTAKLQELTSMHARLVKDLQGHARTTTRELSPYTTMLSNLLRPLM